MSGDAVTIPGFAPYVGQHCETVATGSLLGAAGVSLSEPMMFGLGEGLGFIFLNLGSLPLPFVGGRSKPFALTTALCANLGIDCVAVETSSKAKAWSSLEASLRQGQPVGLQVGRCRGACVGKEPRAIHLARVKLALMPQRLQEWPHEGPMLVREGAGERVQYHVIDGWQHLGTVERGSDVPEIEEFQRMSSRARRGSFDIDSYRILTRLLREPRYRPMPLPHS